MFGGWVRTGPVCDVTCFKCACPYQHGLYRVPSGRGGWIGVEFAWLSLSRGLFLDEPPVRVSRSGGWSKGMVQAACYLHTWALVYFFV